MTLSEALTLGVLQGLTEFLPISSSGHLVLARSLWRGVERPELLFDVVVHLGTIAATVLVLRRRVATLLRAAFLLPFRRRTVDPTDTRWLALIAVACVATGAIGLALRGSVEAVHTRPAWVGGALLGTAALLVACERFGTRVRGSADLGWIDAVVVGVMQGIAVIPGISRSGATVSGALFRDVRGETAVEFSMMISIPAVIAANLLEGSRAAGTLSTEIFPLLIGFIAAFLVGVLSLRALQWAVTRRRLGPFAGYCVVLGLGAVILG